MNAEKRNVENSDDNYTARPFLTAFIDLLGISENLKLFHYYEAEEPTDEIKKKIEGTLNSISEFRNTVTHYYDKIIDEIKTTHGFNLNIHIQILNDALVISIPVEPELSNLDYQNIYGLLFGCAVAQFNALINNMPARGGIAFGYGTKLKSGEILGVNFIRSYELESKQALYPRILIEPYLFSRCFQISNHIEKVTYTIVSDINQMLRQDQDGYWYLDFLGPKIFSVVGNDDGKISIIDKILAPYFNNPLIIPIDERKRRETAKWAWLGSYWKKIKPEVLQTLQNGTSL